MVSWGIFLVLGLVFILSVKREPRFFGNCILLIGIAVSFFNALIVFAGQNQMMRVSLRNFIFIFVPFIMVIVALLLFIDGIYLFWKDRTSLNISKILKNLMAPLSGVGLVAGLFLIYNLVRQYKLHFAETVILLFLVYYYIYLAFSIAAFWLYSWFYQQLPRKFSCEYIIVLGCRVFGEDKLSATLMSRLDKAIEVYQKSDEQAVFIVSGGKGADEPVSEASAMKWYLLSKGIPANNIIMEEKSRNTYENLLFSKQLLQETKSACEENLFIERNSSLADKRSAKKRQSLRLAMENKRVLYVTSNYHVMRAGIYARKVGLAAQGVGSRTNIFYWPGAFFREYIAVSVKHKTGLILCGVLWLLTVLKIYFKI